VDVTTGPVKALSDHELAAVVGPDGITFDGSRVIAPDIVASNGIIHVIDSVIVPTTCTDPATPDEPVPAAGALVAPDEDSGPVIDAVCSPTCNDGKVCAKHSSTEDAKHSKCYPKCKDDAKTGNGCETPAPGDETCIHHYSDETGITSWCECKGAADGKEGDYEWVCMAK
jgi:hypothetical protein